MDINKSQFAAPVDEVRLFMSYYIHNSILIANKPKWITTREAYRHAPAAQGSSC